MSARVLRFRQTSQAKTATFSTADIPFDEDWLQLLINVTAVSGTTPQMVVTVEGKDEDGAYVPLYTSAAISTVSKLPVSIGTDTPNNSLIPGTIRITFTIIGTTPSFTFTVSAYAGRIGG